MLNETFFEIFKQRDLDLGIFSPFWTYVFCPPKCIFVMLHLETNDTIDTD